MNFKKIFVELADTPAFEWNSVSVLLLYRDVSDIKNAYNVQKKYTNCPICG